MNTLSNKCKYALKALYILAREEGHGPVLIGTIAARERIPKKFLQAILLELRNRGVVESKLGRSGGYLLAKPASNISLGSVIRMIDGPLAPLPCASETAYRKCAECVDEKVCGTRMIMRDVRNAIAAILDNTTLADYCARVKQAGGVAEVARENLMYYI